MTDAVNTGAEEANIDFLAMSDEDFLKVNSPAAPVEETAVEEIVNEGQLETAALNTAVSEEEGAEGTGDEEVGAAAADEVTGAEGAATTEEEKTNSQTPTLDANGKPVVETPEQIAAKAAAAASKLDANGQPIVEPAASEQVQPVNYEEFYKQMMKPFKANGKNFELKSPEEALRLMQMGAGYGKKIQDMQPHLKVLRMLEKNGLLDEGKLSFLIDINKKNPDAIKKIIKESGIDPLDLNIEDNVSYNPTNHAVSDNEMKLHTAIADVQALPNGAETLTVINQTWDQESKSLLWESPEILEIIQDQRDRGLYDQITVELDRRKLLGQIPHSMPFIKAYKQVGDYMEANKLFTVTQAEQIQTQPVVQPQAQVIATRTAAPKPVVQNGDKAAAASPTVTSNTRKATTTVNPLQMADEDFMKQFAGRF